MMPRTTDGAYDRTSGVVAVAVHDGFYGATTGAGRSNRAFLDTLCALLAPDVELLVLPIRVPDGVAGHDARWHHDTSRMIAQTGGTVLPVDNGSGGRSRFGRLPNFQAAGIDAARLLAQRLHGRESRALIVAFDVPFFGLAAHLPSALRDHLVIVPRATAVLHTPDDTERIAWEIAGLHAAATAGAKIAAISTYMRAHLARDYQLPIGCFTDMFNGFTAADLDDLTSPFPYTLPQRTRGGFLFALGRAEIHKGFDDLLDAIGLLRSRGIPVPHLVLAAVASGDELTPYQQHLHRRVSSERFDATLVARHDATIRRLLTHSALAAAVVPSRVEPFGRVPLEALAAGAAPLVATTAGGIAEFAIDGETALTAPPADPAGLAAALHRALTLGPADRHRLREAGWRTAARYDYTATISGFLTLTAPWALTR